MPRKIRISHSAGSERILSDDEESSSGTGIQVSPSDESQEYSDSVPEEEEWTPVDIFDDDEIEPSDSASRPSSKPPRPLRHRSNHHRQPRPSSYHHSSHRSVAEEHTARRPSYRKHRESHSYREHRDHRRPPSVHSDSLDSHDDYPGYARGPPLPHHPHHQWSHVPSHGPPGGYGGSMVSSGGYNPFTGGMSHPSTQLVSLSSHPDMYGYPPPNPFSPSAHSQPNPFSPAASSASGATGYFDHHRGAYGRGTHPPRHGEMMPYGAHAGAGPYQYPYGSSMYYYAGAHADSPPPPPHPHPHPPPPRSYSRPGSVPQEPGKGKEDDEVVAKLEKLILEQNQKAAEAAPKKEEEDKFTKLEKLIMLQKEDQIAREKAAEEKAAKEKADAEAKVAKEAAEKKAAEEAAKALVDAAAIARAEAEIKAKGEAAKAKEEHDKKVKELEVAAAEAIKKAEALKGPDDDKMPPIKFKDAVGRKFRFPWKICKTWQGMEGLIKQAFIHVDVIGPQVQEGQYDLMGSNGEIILPQVWETVIEPDASVSMHIWQVDEPKKSSRPATPAALGMPNNVVVVEPAQPSKKKNKKAGKSSSAAAALAAASIPPPPPILPAGVAMPPPPPPVAPSAPVGDIPMMVPPPPLPPSALGPLPPGVSVVMNQGSHAKKKKPEKVPGFLAYMAGQGRTPSTKKSKK